ncbi:hypothetical protein AAUPMC_05572, partial [Pasteurella multocida subsp. multocida str. Anand1_cattle]
QSASSSTILKTLIFLLRFIFRLQAQKGLQFFYLNKIYDNLWKSVGDLW